MITRTKRRRAPLRSLEWAKDTLPEAVYNALWDGRPWRTLPNGGLYYQGARLLTAEDVRKATEGYASDGLPAGWWAWWYGVNKVYVESSYDDQIASSFRLVLPLLG